MANKKITQKLLREFHEHNKLMRRVKAKEKTLDEYVKYVSGKLRKKPKLIVEPMKVTTLVRASPVVESGIGISAPIPAKESFQYTGERKLLGIACMHKSNLVPVFEQKDAEDISKMRRS